MKLVFREYLASLRERRELDVVLPDLLSELGYTVISRPSIGPRQYGVDVAALGPPDNGERKLYLFSIKQGDLTRADWDGTPQALRGSINEILDFYIPTLINKEYQGLPIVICLCFGGDIVEAVRGNVAGFINQHTTPRVSFEEWNGDLLAGLLSEGVLRAQLVDKSLRSSFQKAVAMVDEPEISYKHFASLISGLSKASTASLEERLTALRQAYICLWVLFVWARDAGNVESSYRASELALLNAWNFIRTDMDSQKHAAVDMRRTFSELFDLHCQIGRTLLDGKILPFVTVKHAVSVAVTSRSPVDISLKLFEVMSRLAMRGLWMLWEHSFNVSVPEACQGPVPPQAGEVARQIIQLIQNNPALLAPIADEQAVDIGITLIFLTMIEESLEAAGDYAQHLISRILFAYARHHRYPTIHSEYRELVVHPRERTVVYREAQTKGSTLIPMLSIWASALGHEQAAKHLSEFAEKNLKHCNMQLWIPGSDTDEHLYLGDAPHGLSLNDIPITSDGKQAMNLLKSECEERNIFAETSAIKYGHWPIFILACKLTKLPLPPHLWYPLLDDRKAQIAVEKSG